MKTLLSVLVAALMWCSSAMAVEQKVAPGRSGKILIEYVPPEDPKHEALYKFLKERQVLEQIQMVLSPFKLPRNITLRTKGCKGVRNAWYDDEDLSITRPRT